jgi:carbon-monoxide dehydrogenase medium subunit
MKPIEFEYFAPKTLAEALDKLNDLGYSGKVLAGGQSLIPAMNFRMARPANLVDLNNIPELAFIRPSEDGGLVIGTMTRDSAIEVSSLVEQRFPLIIEAMKFIAHPQIRNRGTFGGAIAHADPAAQLPAVVLALNARLKIAKKGSERWVSVEEFFLGPFMTVIEPEEILSEIAIPPLPDHTGSSYHQQSRQRGGYAMAAVAAVVTLDDAGKCKQVRMVTVGVGDTSILSKEAPKMLIGQKPTAELIKAVADRVTTTEIDPGSDIHATADYRRHLTHVMIVRALTDAFERAAK